MISAAVSDRLRDLSSDAELDGNLGQMLPTRFVPWTKLPMGFMKDVEKGAINLWRQRSETPRSHFGVWSTGHW